MDILLVEDDPGQARLTQRALERTGIPSRWVQTAADCLREVRAQEPDIILLDRGLPDGDGLEILASLRADWPGLGVIMLTGADDVTVAVRAMRAGAADYVLKRPDLSYLQDLPLVVERTRERIELRREREALNQAMRASEERYRQLFNNASDLMFHCDLEGVIQQVNRAFEDLTGVSPDDARGRPLGAFVAGSSPTSAEALRDKTLGSVNEHVSAEVHLKGVTGHPVVVEVRARPIREAGDWQGFQGIGRDVSEKRRMEGMKADFLAMITHDMKNPISVIVGYTEILLNDTPPENPARDMLVSIDSSARGLLHLILNFLDVSRIEAGALRLNRVPTSVNEVLREVIEYERPLARAKRIHIDEDLGATPQINGDRLQLDRIFVNIVGNAIKFTPAGGRVSVKTMAENGSVCVAVSDTGPGIPSDQISCLFGKYQRLSQTAQVDGTGLGLFIAKCMVDAHDGLVRVQSTPGCGATFTVILPARS